MFAGHDAGGDRTIPRDHWVDVPGRGRMYVRVAGGPRRAPVLVLLHGLGATAALNWDPVMPALARRFRVMAPDLRGHGRGPRCGGRFRLEDCADDVAGLVEATVGGPVLVAGYSMGGPVTKLLCRRHPGHVAGMILCATARDFRGTPLERLQFGLLGPLALASRLPPQGWWPSLLPSGVRHRGLLPALVDEIGGHQSGALVAAAASLGTFTSRSWIEELAAPAVVVAARRDGLVPVRRQHKLAASLRAPVVEVDGNHFVARRHPDRLAAAIIDAIALLPRRARAGKRRSRPPKPEAMTDTRVA